MGRRRTDDADPHHGRMISLLAAAFVLSSCVSLPPEDRPWIEARTEHFVVYSEAAREETLELARDLELFRAVVITIIGLDLEPIVSTYTYVFDRASHYRRFAPRGSAGFIQSNPSANFIAIDITAPGVGAREILYHEYVHFMVRNHERLVYPMWLDEGMAMLLAPTRVKGDRVLVGDVPSYVDVALKLGDFLSLGTIMGAREYPDYSREHMAMFYAESWALTRFLVIGWLSDGDDRRPQLGHYVTLLNQGVDESRAFEQAFDTTRRGLERKMRAYYARRQRILALPISALDVQADVGVRFMSREETSEHLGWLSFVGRDDPKHAEALFRKALESEPDRPRALAGLGSCQGLQERYDEAEVTWRTALAAGADDPEVHLHHGDYLLARVLDHDDKREEKKESKLSDGERRGLLREARRSYSRSLKLAAGQPAAHAGIGMSYVLAGEEPDRGIAELERARAILRWDQGINLWLAKGYLAASSRAGNPRPDRERARALLLRVVQWSHGEDDSSREALELLEELEASGNGADL